MRRLRVLQHHRAQRKPRSRKSLREFKRGITLPTCPEPSILSFSGGKNDNMPPAGRDTPANGLIPAAPITLNSQRIATWHKKTRGAQGTSDFLLTKGGVICHAVTCLCRLRRLRRLHHRRHRCHRSHHTRRTSSFPPRIARSFSCTQAE